MTHIIKKLQKTSQCGKKAEIFEADIRMGGTRGIVGLLGHLVAIFATIESPCKSTTLCQKLSRSFVHGKKL